jgi:hypothetical protein
MDQSLKQQQVIVQTRAQMVENASEAVDTRVIDETFRKQLIAASPEGLAPVMVRRNHDDWFAAYLIQRIGAHGCRLLTSDWTITRVKRTALVALAINPSQHHGIIEKQRELAAAIRDALAVGGGACAKSRRALTTRKSKSLTVRSS